MITPFGRATGDERPALQLIRPEDRFRTGGATSVRGYSQDEIGGQDEAAAREGAGNDPLVSLGGRFLLVSNLEVRFPLWGILSGAAFLDGGNVWRTPSDVTLRAFSPYALRGPDSFDRFRYSVGGGLRLGTPVGPFRVDYGVKLNPPEVGAGQERPRTAWHFSLGQAF
jgi:outer membrane protein insertion porin family